MNATASARRARVPAPFDAASSLTGGPGAAPYDARGERRLLLAVLNDAIETLARTVTALDLEARRSFAETERWLGSTDGVFSFAGICAALGVDDDRLRSKIRALVAARRRTAVAAPAAVRPAPAQRRVRA